MIVVLHHDCEFDSEDFHLVGPFPTSEDASAFIEKYTLHTPSDGGYAFATVVEVEGMHGVTDPGEYEPEGDIVPV